MENTEELISNVQDVRKIPLAELARRRTPETEVAPGANVPVASFNSSI